ncbi:MAG: ACP phosphodiesterase [Bacteroidales bacterium]
MNFLAHLYLSANDAEIKTGNFIGDFVKGSAHINYSRKIQQGILLHRKIDHYTDRHPVTKELSQLVKSKFHRHAGIVIDIFYDHFLSRNWSLFSDDALNTFINKCHHILLANFFILPGQVKSFLPVMIAKNRLQSYYEIEGIENALKIMSKYTSLPAESSFAVEVMKNNYGFINDKFIDFFSEIIDYVNLELKKYNEEDTKGESDKIKIYPSE